MEDTLKQILNEMKGLKEDVTDLKLEVTNIKQSQERTESKVDTLDTKVDSLSLELRSNFKYTNDKLDEHRKVFEVVSDEMKGVNVDIEYLSSKTGKHDMELNHIINKLKG